MDRRTLLKILGLVPLAAVGIKPAAAALPKTKTVLAIQFMSIDYGYDTKNGLTRIIKGRFTKEQYVRFQRDMGQLKLPHGYIRQQQSYAMDIVTGTVDFTLIDKQIRSTIHG